MINVTKPNLPPLLSLKGSRGGYYVYTYQNVWDAEKKRSKRTNSKLVGKIIGGGKEGVVEFTPEFIEQHPELEFILTKKVGSKYEFTSIEPEEVLLKNHKRPVAIKNAGATWALDNIVARTPLAKALKIAFPMHKDYLKILSLAYFIVLNQNNSMYRYEEFSESTLLPYNKVMDSSVITRLCKRITKDQIDTFISVMNELYFKHYAKEDETDNIYLALDSTSISTYSDQLDLAQWGHNKDLDELKQINVLMLVDQRNGIPLFYRSYDGAIPDVVTIRNTIAQCTNLKLNKNIVFVSDKGYHSSTNINDCLRNDFGFIFNTKVNVKGSFIQEEVDAIKTELLSCANFKRKTNSNCVVRDIDWCYDAYPVSGKKQRLKDKAKLRLHIYFNKEIFDDQYKVIVHNADKAIDILKEANGNASAVHPIFIKLIEAYTDYTYDKDTNTYTNCRINPLKVDERLKYAGIRVLITNQLDLTSEQCHIAYFERGKVEYAFNTLKYRLGCNRWRCSDNRSLDGKAFVQFIATAISLQVRHQLKQYKEKMKNSKIKSSIIYDSDNKILSSLNCIHACIYDYGVVYDEVVGKKAAFFEALGVDVPKSGYFPELSSSNDSDDDENDPEDMDPQGMFDDFDDIKMMDLGEDLI